MLLYSDASNRTTRTFWLENLIWTSENTHDELKHASHKVLWCHNILQHLYGSEDRCCIKHKSTDKIVQRKCRVRQSPTDFHDRSRHFPSTGYTLNREHARNAAFCSERAISPVTMHRERCFCIPSPSKGGLSTRRVGNALSPSLSWSCVWTSDSLFTPCRKIGLNFPSILKTTYRHFLCQELRFVFLNNRKDWQSLHKDRDCPSSIDCH